MKKDKTNDGSDKRKMSKLEKENAELKAQVEQLKSDKRQQRTDLSKASKKERRRDRNAEQRTTTITFEAVKVCHENKSAVCRVVVRNFR